MAGILPKVTILINLHGEETYIPFIMHENELRVINAVPVGCYSCIPFDITPDIIEKELNLMNISRKQINIKQNLENYLPILNKKFNSELCEYKKNLEDINDVGLVSDNEISKYSKISTMTEKIIDKNCFNISIPSYNRIYNFNSSFNLIDGNDDIRIIHYNNNPQIDDIFNRYKTFNNLKNHIYSFHLIENQNDLYNKYTTDAFADNYIREYGTKPSNVFEFDEQKNKIIESMTNIFEFKNNIKDIENINTECLEIINKLIDSNKFYNNNNTFTRTFQTSLQEIYDLFTLLGYVQITIIDLGCRTYTTSCCDKCNNEICEDCTEIYKKIENDNVKRYVKSNYLNNYGGNTKKNKKKNSHKNRNRKSKKKRKSISKTKCIKRIRL